MGRVDFVASKPWNELTNRIEKPFIRYQPIFPLILIYANSRNCPNNSSHTLCANYRSKAILPDTYLNPHGQRVTKPYYLKQDIRLETLADTEHAVIAFV